MTPDGARVTHLVFALSAAVLTAAVFFGGGARLGAPTDFVPELLSLPLFYYVLGPGWRRLGEAPALKMLVVSAFGIILLQLVPLPPAIWTALPGRPAIRLMLEDAGTQPGWLSLSLRPHETLKVFLALLPPTALLFAVLVMDLKQRVWLLALAAGLALVSVVLGLLQLLNGPGSPLYFHQFTSPNRAVGFFANPNHFTALLYATLPLASALMAGFMGRRARIVAIACGAIAFAYLVGLSISGSRTALLLGGMSLAASFLLMARSGAFAGLARRRLAFVGGLAALTIVPVLMGVGLLTILDRLGSQDLIDDLRWQILPASVSQAWAYFPFGSGLGTFEKAYALNESVSLLIPSFINHVHNDWVEVLYEAGVLGLVPMGFCALVLARMSLGAARAEPSLSAYLQAGGAIAVGLLLLHSLWDYPLRTQACLSVMAIALALSVAPTRANIESVAEAIPGLGRARRKRRRKSRRPAEVAA